MGSFDERGEVMHYNVPQQSLRDTHAMEFRGFRSCGSPEEVVAILVYRCWVFDSSLKSHHLYGKHGKWSSNVQN
jgi:hypothetical protein